jgi:hypothetical protein
MRTKIVSVFVVFISMILLETYAIPLYGQGAICSLTDMTVNAPPTAPAGQPLELNIAVRATCPNGGFYLIKEELTDPNTDQRFAQAQTTYMADEYYTLVNDVTTPKGTGSWTLEVSIYVIDQTSGQAVAPQSQLTFSIDIVPYTAQTTITSMSSSSLTTTNSTSTSMTTIPPATSITSVQTLTTITTSGQEQNYAEYEYIIAGGVIVLLIIVAVISRIKQRTKPDQTQVY